MEVKRDRVRYPNGYKAEYNWEFADIKYCTAHRLSEHSFAVILGAEKHFTGGKILFCRDLRLV